MATEPNKWTPDWAVPPGDILREVLEERGMSQVELSKRIDRPKKTISEIINGKAAITAETAIQLERALGVTARFWNRLESDFREARARQQADAELENEADWAARFPFRELQRYGVLEAGDSKARLAEHLLEFFRVSNRSAWERTWLAPVVSYRKSPVFASAPEAVSAWLRWGEILAEKVECDPFDAPAFRRTLTAARDLTREPINSAIDRLQEVCAACGVAVVLTPELGRAPINGAVRWPSARKAVIQLSLRQKSDDQFWYTFFHEGEHVLQGYKQGEFVDGEFDETEDASAEEQANSEARNLLIPLGDLAAFLQRADFSIDAVRTFARELGIAPGLVVGRLQRDGHLAPSALNHLKKPLRWGRPTI